MSYNVIAIPSFKRDLKKLAKKYPSLKGEFAAFVQRLEQEPQLGTGLGNNCYKVRIAIKSKGKGKSGGGRAITHVIVIKKEVYLLSIYDKADKESLSDEELEELLKQIP